MNSIQFPVDAEFQHLLNEAGAIRWGVAYAGPVDEAVHSAYLRWIAEGYHAGMDYLDRHAELRVDPRLLLDGTNSVISIAIPYRHPDSQRINPAARIASYALGDDYHDVVRKRLKAVAEAIEKRFGGATRICVDTAPIHERYWAIRAGVGRQGRSGQIIVPGAGTYCFLAEILTTVRFTPTSPLPGNPCGSCRRCIEACPGGALSSSHPFDARRCLSYLTIEHRGPLPSEPRLQGCLYGCDRCSEVCPHNSHPTYTTLPEFTPRPALLDISAQQIMSMDTEEYTRLFRRSPMKRAKLDGLRRNAIRLIEEKLVEC